jgi:quercetin dioxygenase-like cupin family protein
MTESKVFKFGAAPMTFNAAGGGSSQTLPRTTIPSGELVGVHVGTIPAKTVYSAMHANGNCEILIIHEGSLEFMEEGKPTQLAEKGDVIYAAAHIKHSLRNPGDKTMTYFVVAIGGTLPAAAPAKA